MKILNNHQPVLVIPTTQYKRNEIVAIIREIWPDEYEENPLFIANRESNMNPNVVGGVNDCCVRSFQTQRKLMETMVDKVLETLRQ